MMKKVLSVALSVIMVLGLICVPSFAADSAAVEYTVSNVSYAGEVYDELNPAADANGYALVDGITSIPENGKKLVPSVEVSATAETTATVIFAVFTDGVLTNAFYETKAVGTTAVEFSKEITVVDNTKETYEVFVLGADGKAIAPVSNFPVAENALEYIVISYADGTEDKYFGADLEGTTLVSAISDARKAANPSIKVVPVDNTTVVTIDIAADFWTNGATVKLTAIDGTEVTYTIMSDMIKAGFTPVLGKIYQYEGATLIKTIKTYEKQYASFEASAEVVNVTVPYGTASVNLDAITVYENGVPKKSAAEEISMDGAAEKEYMVGVGSKEYKFVFKWDDSAPYITNVKFGGGYAARSIVLRADGASAIGYSNSTDISKTPESATITGQLAGTGANTDLTVNGVAIPNNSDFTLLALAREDNFVRTDMIQYVNNNWAHMTENEAWTSFKISEPATVYVKMSHANAGEADFVWKEGAVAGWTKATSSNQGTIYYKTFAAGETVNVPSQVVTEEELAFVNAKLATAYPATGEVQFKYVLAENGAVFNYSSDGKAYDDASKTWEAHPTGKNSKSDGAKLAMADGKYYRGLYYRNAGSATGLTVEYGSPLFIAVAFDNTPGEGGDPVDPPTPAAPTLSYTTKLALTGEPKTSGSEGTNIANNYGTTSSLHAGGIYKVAVQSDSIELNPEDTTVDIEVAYGTEAIVLNDTTTIDLLTNNGTGTANVTVEGVEYTVNVSWKAFAAADMSADAPLLYNLKYYVADKTNLVAGTYYNLVPTTMKLDAASDWVYGEGDVTKVTDGSLMYAEGNWITLDSHRAGNYLATINGSNLGRLHLAGESFKSFVEKGYAASKYALNGATLLVAHYQDTKAATVVSPRYTFNSAVKGYVVAAFTNENAALTADGWTLLADAKIVTSNKSIGTQGSAETGAGYHFGFPSTPYEYVYVKAVNVGTEVSIKEAAGANENDCNPIVLVATEAMLNVDLEAPVEPEIPPVDPEDPPVVEPTTQGLASLSYTTALAVTAPKESVGANGHSAASLHANGFYQPTLVTEAAAVEFVAEATTIDVIVPYGSEIVNLAGVDSNEGAVAFDAINLINNNGVATVTKTVDEIEYTINVKWADYVAASDAAGNHVYDVKYRIRDLADATYYNAIPTKISITENRIAPQTVIGYKDAAGATVYAQAGEWYKTNTVAAGKSNLMTHLSGAQINRARLSTIAFDGWVRNGLVTASGVPGAALPAEATDAEVDAIAYAAMNGATTLVAHYQDYTSLATAAGANAAMAEHLSFKVAQDSIVYVSTSSTDIGTGWTKFNAGKLYLHNQTNNPIYVQGEDETYTKFANNFITHDYSAAGSNAFYRYAKAGDTVSLTLNTANSQCTPVVLVRPIDEIPEIEEPVEPEIPEEEVQPFGDIEDAGMAVLAETVEAPEAAQDAASTDISVEGNKGAEARGEHVVVYVLADGKSFADIQTALAGGSGDLVADGVILGMGSATVDENGDYTVDMTLPNSVTSGSYDVVIDGETHEDALEYTAIAEKVAAYNAIVTGAADPFAHVDLIISTNDIYTGLTPAGKAAVEASVLAKDSVAALPVITEPTPGEYVGLENIALLAAIIDTRVAVEALNDGADVAELALVWDYILPEANAESADIVEVAAAIYEDAAALNATGKANVVAAISGKDFETKTVEGAQVSVKTQVQDAFAEAAFVELINNTAYTNVNAVHVLVNKYIEDGKIEGVTSVSSTKLADILKNETITSYDDFAGLLDDGAGEGITGGTEVVEPGVNPGTTTGGMSSSNGTSAPDPAPAKKQLSDFVDAGDAAWAATALQLMLDREILTGYEDDTIRPNNNATRQEVAKMLVEAFSEVRATAWTGFADVPAGSWYYSYVATAQEDGIIKGVSATDFGTDALITREDLSVLIYRFLDNKGIAMNTNANRAFTDASLMSDYAVDAINALANAGIVNGYEDGSYNPKGYATRAEIAQVIANVIARYGL